MDRQSLAQRIQALLAKTTARGCTEAEALAAAEKAQELLAIYQMSKTDLELEAEGLIRWLLTKDEMKRLKFPASAIADLGFGIARFTDCKGWTWSGGRDGFEFAGLRSDVEFATWLTQSLMQFCINAHSLHELATFENVDRRQFIGGLAFALRQRMLTEVAKRGQGQTSGRDLVVVKRPLIDEFLKSQGIFLSRGRSRAVSYGAAATAGASYASRAGFGRPVGGGQARITKG